MNFAYDFFEGECPVLADGGERPVLTDRGSVRF